MLSWLSATLLIQSAPRSCPKIMSSQMDNRTLYLGVLCIQGAFIEHIQMLHAVSNIDKHREVTIMTIEVRKPQQLASLDGLIIPGGESTTLSVFLRKDGFEESLKSWISNETNPGLVWGTCAGLILLANEVAGKKIGGQITLGGLDIECSRNMYGRQLNSFESPVKLHHPPLHETTPSNTPHDECHGIFIRAPGILKVTSPNVKVLATVANTENHVVAVQQNNLIATSFHPELANDLRWHTYFVDQILEKKYSQN